MEYEIIRVARGKKSVEDSGSLRKMKARLRQLRSSTARGVSGQGGKKYSVSYALRKVENG